MKGLFVTGTDTGCGKTTVAVLLASLATARGLRVRVLKPVETGCAPHAEDALALARAADDARPLERICPYRLALPASPDVAAAAEGVQLSLEPIEDAFAEAARDADLLLVEGAGGLLVPLGPELDMLALAERLRLPLLVVARATLGTINHTWLTLQAARSRGRPVAALAVSHTSAQLSPADRANLGRLLADLPVPFLGELAYGGKQLEPELDIEAFLGTLVAG